MTTIIKKVTIRGRYFTVVKNEEGYYLAIEDKYIDATGRLNTQLNGMQMHASKDLNMCLECTKDAVEVDYLKSTGLSKDEAFAVWFKTKYGTEAFNRYETALQA